MSSSVPGQARKIAFVDLAAQHAAMEEEIAAALARVLKKGDFILGEDVARFESEFAEFCEAAYAVGVDSGTSALELSLRAYGVTHGDEVITAANTFIATALAISYTGATPVLVDADRHTCTMDVPAIERALTPRTKAIIPVHLYGQPADMGPILEIARLHRLIVIEDACQAHGARYAGKRAGTLADAAAFSFYPGKNLGALGDGGMIVTNDKRVAERARMLRNYGEREKYHHELRGFNRRLDTIQAAVLRLKLKRLDGWNAARRRHAAEYRQLLAGSGVEIPADAAYSEPVHHIFAVRAGNRDELRSRLAEVGIATGIHYPVPIHLQPAYAGLGYREGDFPVSETFARQMFSLPMYPELNENQIAAVCGVVRRHARPCEPSAAEVRPADTAM